jgi:hypothetical protein
MAHYYLYENDGVKLHVTLDAFIQQLWQRWPEADIDRTPSQPTILSWEISSAHDIRVAGLKKVLAGSINQDRAQITLIGNEEMCIDFSLWYRSLVPAHVALFLQYSDVNALLEIHQETTVREIADFFIQDIDVVQEKILRFLVNQEGKVLSNVLIAEMQGTTNAPKKTSDIQIIFAIEDLWKKGLISSPGTKWIMSDEDSTYGNISGYVSHSYLLTITDKGLLAVRSKKD